MNIMIAGDSDIALHLARLLYDENHNISLFYPEGIVGSSVGQNLDVMLFSGDPTSLHDLKNANIKKTDLFISVFLDGRTNLLACILGKNLGAKKCIAKVNETDYSVGESRDMFKNLGVDYVVCPEKIAAKEITNLIINTAATEIFDFTNQHLSLMLIRLTENARVLGKSLNQIAEENADLDFRAVALHRKSKTIIPRGDDVFRESDLAYVVTKPEGIDHLLRLGGKNSFTINNIMIVGGGTVGTLTAKNLEKDYKLKLIELNKETSSRLADDLRNTMIIHGDAHDVALLERENIQSMDAVIAVTNNSETNILTCLLAKKYGVRKTIALVENINFIEISQNIGIDTIINKKLATASYIIRFTMKAEVISTKCLNGIDAEIFEFRAHANSPITRKPINKLKFPSEAIIGGIIRDNTGIIARGDLQIQPGDYVVVFTLPEAFDAVDRMFRS
ncbi:MAG: Trk system potassium transporter TrkA [Bacteroidetes bacterium]|nr:MAG: Trk system potassium transporter TrkA [Bacteroidota bacterium]